MRNEPWVWPEVRDAGTSGAGAVPLRSAQLMGQKKTKQNKKKNPKKQQQKNNLHKHIAFVFLIPVVCSAYEYDA